MLAGAVASLFVCFALLHPETTAASPVSQGVRLMAAAQEAKVAPLDDRTLGDGQYFRSGKLSSQLHWQASGVLARGGAPFRVYKIKDVYMSYLNSTGMLQSTLPPDPSTKPGPPAPPPSAPPSAAQHPLPNETDSHYNRPSTRPEEPKDKLAALFFQAPPPPRAAIATSPALQSSQLILQASAPPPNVCALDDESKYDEPTTSPPSLSVPPPKKVSARQRNELYSWPPVMGGQARHYEWKTHLVAGVSTNNNFFHLWQILSRAGNCGGGPTIGLDAKKGKVMVMDFVRGCNDDDCPSIPLSDWVGKTIVHSLSIEYGCNGWIKYSAADVNDPTVPLLAYNAEGEMGDRASLKFGLYRLFVKGMSEARCFMGDYSEKVLK